AGGETRHRAQPAPGAAIASSDVRCGDRFRSGRETWRALLLVDAVDCGGVVLRAQDRETRCGRDQSRFLSKQRVRQRSVLASSLLGSIELRSTEGNEDSEGDRIQSKALSSFSCCLL